MISEALCSFDLLEFNKGPQQNIIGKDPLLFMEWLLAIFTKNKEYCPPYTLALKF